MGSLFSMIRNLREAINPRRSGCQNNCNL